MAITARTHLVAMATTAGITADVWVGAATATGVGAGRASPGYGRAWRGARVAGYGPAWRGARVAGFRGGLRGGRR